MFRDYFEYYKRECKALFLDDVKSIQFKNLLMYKSKLTNRNKKGDRPMFLCKGTATKIWRDLIKEGLSLKLKWRNFSSSFESLDYNVMACLGDSLFEILKSPDLTVPALIKEDKNVDFHSVYSQYLYEYIFRIKSLCLGQKPTTTFTFLSESECMIKEALSNELYNVDQLTEEIKAYEETQIFMNLRWYCDAFQQPTSSGNFLTEKLMSQSETSNRLSNQFNSYYTTESNASTNDSLHIKGQIFDIFKEKDVKSNLNSMLTTIFDTITFHCKLTNQIIKDVQDEREFLQEYDKRWNAFVASMIKLDEILSPLARIVNKVYKRIYPDYPCFPLFSFLRVFVIIWKREVYKF